MAELQESGENFKNFEDFLVNFPKNTQILKKKAEF
jgi:hypothetical protein